MWWPLLSVLLTTWLPCVARAEVFSLSGLNWTLKNSNGSIAIPGAVPSQAHLDLLRAGIIDEPLLGTNGQYRFAKYAGAPLLRFYRVQPAVDHQ